MAHWNTDQITSDLQALFPKAKITNQGQGGDVDTDNLHIKLKGSTDGLFICGFDDEVEDTLANTDVDVPYIEITDGLDSRGGLNSSDQKVAEAFIVARQYFIKKGFHVVPTHKAFF